MANIKCKECGCTCKKCISHDYDIHLHLEIENLKKQLTDRENHIVTMETNFLNEADKLPNGQFAGMQEELLTLQDKYRRLHEAHRRVQRVNQGLEDKLLKLVDVGETEKNALTKDVSILSQKLAEANYTIKKLTEDNERYKQDVSLAIQFLQCKQSNFVAHKFDSLPQEVQTQVSSYMTHKRKPDERRTSHEMKSIKVPIPTFPPTAMVYSVSRSPKPRRRSDTDGDAPPPVDVVSAAIMAKVLEERQKEKSCAKHCDTCTCPRRLHPSYDVAVQTLPEAACTRCEKRTGDGNVVMVQPNNFLIGSNESLSISSAKDKSQNNLSESTERRVADWVERTTNKPTENREEKIDYAQMEENVKRFLFGETDFLRTVEIGKQKYQDYRDDTKSLPTETQI